MNAPTTLRQREFRKAFEEYLGIVGAQPAGLGAGAALRTLLEFQHEVLFDWMISVVDGFEDALDDTVDEIVMRGELRPLFEMRSVGTFGLFKRQRRVAVPGGRFVVTVARRVETPQEGIEAGLELEFCARDFQGLGEFELASLDFGSTRDFLAAVLGEPSFIRANALRALEVRVVPAVADDSALAEPASQGFELPPRPAAAVASSNVA
jgi:hypothetical protein